MNTLNAIGTYTHFSQFRQELEKPSAAPDAEVAQALVGVEATTRKIMGSGLVGQHAKDATAIAANLEKTQRLTQGDINAVNLKAAVDIGEKLARGTVQNALSLAAAPIAAAASLETLDDTFARASHDPSPQNLKAVMNSTKAIGTSFSQLSRLTLEYGDDVVTLAARHSDTVANLAAQSAATGATGLVRTGLNTTSQTLGKVSQGLTVGVAAMDVWIGVKDVQDFLTNPSMRNLLRAGLGSIAAGASMASVAKVPVLGVSASLVATLADVGKVGLDVNWIALYHGAADRYKQEVLASRLPQGASLSGASQQLA